MKKKTTTTPTRLTLQGIPSHRVLNGRLVLHYKTKELGWLSFAKVGALRKKGIKVDYR